jgi:hypothetical protein
MKKAKVTCWPIELPGKNGALESGHWISYPEGEYGHDLLVCTKCGHVYAADVTHELYVGPPVTERLKSLAGAGCGVVLSETAMPYPETYRDASGSFHRFERDRVVPSDDSSVIREFDHIYEI